jgi:hypothetical protein
VITLYGVYLAKCSERLLRVECFLEFTCCHMLMCTHFFVLLQFFELRRRSRRSNENETFGTV